MTTRRGPAAVVRRGAVTMAALSLVAAGCGARTVQAGDVDVLVGERSGEARDALGGGVLEVVGGCLGASGSVIVWPHGTEVVDDDPLTVDVPGEGEVALGDEVRLGGGYVYEPTSGGTPPDPLAVAGLTVPASCTEHPVFLAADGG